MHTHSSRHMDSQRGSHIQTWTQPAAAMKQGKRHDRAQGQRTPQQPHPTQHRRSPRSTTAYCTGNTLHAFVFAVVCWHPFTQLLLSRNLKGTSHCRVGANDASGRALLPVQGHVGKHGRGHSIFVWWTAAAACHTCASCVNGKHAWCDVHEWSCVH